MWCCGCPRSCSAVVIVYTIRQPCLAVPRGFSRLKVPLAPTQARSKSTLSRANEPAAFACSWSGPRGLHCCLASCSRHHCHVLAVWIAWTSITFCTFVRALQLLLCRAVTRRTCSAVDQVASQPAAGHALLRFAPADTATVEDSALTRTAVCFCTW